MVRSLSLQKFLFAACCLFVICAAVLWGERGTTANHALRTPDRSSTAATDSVLVSYSYFEKDETQEANFRYFLNVGMGIDNVQAAPEGIDWVVVQSGSDCGPCSVLDRLLEYSQDLTDALAPHLRSVLVGGSKLSVLHRMENEGMDFAAHNMTLIYLKHQQRLHTYKSFVFLNSSVKGPFFPSWVPVGWHWTDAFISRFSAYVKAVGASLACLPAQDLGGPGPRLESWAFALDQTGLQLLVEAGVFEVRSCKLCPDGVVVGSEYALSKVLLDHGYNIATLLAMYPPNVDWREQQHWNCNNNVHPSRHGTYDHMTMHPFETLFVKSSWHVGEPFTTHYSKWFTEIARGSSNTQGQFDEIMYTYAVSPEATMLHGAALDYYRILVHSV